MFMINCFLKWCFGRLEIESILINSHVLQPCICTNVQWTPPNKITSYWDTIYSHSNTTPEMRTPLQYGYILQSQRCNRDKFQCPYMDGNLLKFHDNIYNNYNNNIIVSLKCTHHTQSHQQTHDVIIICRGDTYHNVLE